MMNEFSTEIQKRFDFVYNDPEQIWKKRLIALGIIVFVGIILYKTFQTESEVEAVANKVDRREFASSCEQTWRRFGEYCYHINNAWTRYDRAVAYCDKFDSELASIHGPDENQFLLELLRRKGTDGGGWIGFKLNESKWIWADKTPSDYTNWHKGEPNLLDTEHWAEMRANDGTWNNKADTYPVHAICKKPVD
ncbi:unnamed protein product, partial [Mesorhabditis belari]|uniref:C-type lectin domain-containing protein n=1 Tax=Mesorhabditis belari TaxID=2138241 RepID=A0AAF3FIN4_9BILA